MSWFDSAQLANFASKAIHEAQKKLDKALDIEGEEKSNKGRDENLTIFQSISNLGRGSVRSMICIFLQNLSKVGMI